MSVPRGPTAAEISDGVPANVTIYEFFVSTSADILSINQVTIFGALYQHSLGSDTEPLAPAFVAAFPALGADSWISTPGPTAIAGNGEMTTPNSAWFDSTNNGPQCNFMFARLTTAEPAWNLRGRISLAVPGPGGDPVSFPFGSRNLGDDEYPFPIVQPCVPEPSSMAIAATGLLGLVAVGVRRRMKAWVKLSTTREAQSFSCRR